MDFRIGNTRITISFWFFAVISIFTATNANVLAFYFALPVIIHELGHVLALILCKAKIKSIKLSAFGMKIIKSDASLKLFQEITISLAGVLANLLVAGVLYLHTFQSMRVMLLISANLAVALFNLLPVGDLDGGELARILSEYYLKPGLAYTLSLVFSFLALVPLFAASIYLIIAPDRNFTLMLVCCYLLAGIMIKMKT